MSLPPNYNDCINATTALGVSPEHCQVIANRAKNSKVAPWHYSPRHLLRGGGGNWQFRRMNAYTNDDGKTIHFPPPNNLVQWFIGNMIPAVEYYRGGYDDNLPTFVKIMVTAEAEGAAQPKIDQI